MSEQLTPKRQLGRKEVIFHLSKSELEQFINKEYNLKGKYRYECVDEEEWNNDSSYEFQINKCPFDDKQLEERIKNGTGNKCVRLFLQDSVNNDVIEEGLYIIKVEW